MYSPEQLYFFKFISAVLDEFPVALRLVFVYMWDNLVARNSGYQNWDDSVTVLNLFLWKEGGVKKVPNLNKSYKEWDCTALFRATLFAKSFAMPDGKGGLATLDKLFVKPRNLPSGAFHPSVLSPVRNQTETFALALDQLRLLRNTLCHQSSTREIDKVTFDHYIQLTKDAFAALGQSSTKIDEIGKLGENEFPTARVHQLEEELRRENFKLVKDEMEQLGSRVKDVGSDVKTGVTDVKTKVEDVGSDVKELKTGVEMIVSHLGLTLPISSMPPCTPDNITASVVNQGCVQYKMDEFQIVESMRSYQSGDNKKTARSCDNHGVAFDRKDLNRTLKSKKKASPKSKEHLYDHPENAAFLNNIGCWFLEKSDTKSLYHGDFEKMENLQIALYYIQRAKDMFSRLNKKRLAPPTDTATALQNLGCVDLKMCNDEAAAMAFAKATEIRSSQLGAHENTARSHHWLGVAQLRTGDLQGALKSLQEAADMRTRLQSDHKDTACSYHWLGVVKCHTGDKGGALEAHNIALRLMKEPLRDHPDTAASYFFLGRLHVLLDDDNSAVEAFQKAADTRSNLPDGEDTAEIYHSLGEVQFRLEDRSNAFDSLKKVVQLKKKPLGDQSTTFFTELT